jgi:hypothetical protein
MPAQEVPGVSQIHVGVGDHLAREAGPDPAPSPPPYPGVDDLARLSVAGGNHVNYRALGELALLQIRAHRGKGRPELQRKPARLTGVGPDGLIPLGHQHRDRDGRAEQGEGPEASTAGQSQWPGCEGPETEPREEHRGQGDPQEAMVREPQPQHVSQRAQDREQPEHDGPRQGIAS